MQKSNTGDKLVCKLNQSLYGLKQSGRNWNKMLHDCLCENGFVQNEADHCVYRKQSKHGTIYMLIWVDDLVIEAKDTKSLVEVKEMLTQRFRMKDLGKLKTFLGIEFTQEKGEIRMNQTRFITKILERFHMSDCKARSTPCEHTDNILMTKVYLSLQKGIAKWLVV